MKRFGLVLLVTAIACAQTDISGDACAAREVSGERSAGRPRRGNRGGELATEYIAAQFALAGAKPAGENGTYFQRVPMVGATTSPDAKLSAQRAQSNRVSFKWLDDFVGVSELQQPDDQFDAEAIFVGHGIVAPEFHWDDFKGVDVKGKVLVLFTNEPPSNDPKFFGGRALTYYGRWTYKYEEAARMGAKAVFIIHTTPTAGYGYDVVRSSWGKEDPQLKLQAGQPCAGFRRLVDARRGREAAGAVRKNRGRTAHRRELARLQTHSARHPHPREHPYKCGRFNPAT